MSLWLVPVIIILLGLGTLAVVFARHLAQISVLDVTTIKEERTKQLKERIILQRVERFGAERLGRVGKLVMMGVDWVSKQGRRLVQRLYKLEQYYQRLRIPKEAKADPNAAKRLLDQAEEYVRQDEPVQAEKLFIEVIGHFPKNVDAYEGLGNLYLKNRQYEQARETLRFALRLQPENASVLMSLGELEGVQDNRKIALEHLRQAITVRPKNPKYLDAYIEAAFAAESAEDVRRGLGLMKEVNPENQKLGSFEERLKGLDA